MIDMLGEKPSLLVTNVNGGNEPYSIAGYKSRKISCLTNAGVDITGGFGVISHCDTLWTSFTTDTNMCKDSKQIIKLFEESLDAILAN